MLIKKVHCSSASSSKIPAEEEAEPGPEKRVAAALLSRRQHMARAQSSSTDGTARLPQRDESVTYERTSTVEQGSDIRSRDEQVRSELWERFRCKLKHLPLFKVFFLQFSIYSTEADTIILNMLALLCSAVYEKTLSSLS